MYERFAKKYGSLEDEDDDSFEQGMESDPIVSVLPRPNSPTEVVPGPKGKVEEVIIPELPSLPSFEDTEEEDDPFAEGMNSEVTDDLDRPLTDVTEIVPGKRGKRLSNNEIVKLCDYYYDLATS